MIGFHELENEDFAGLPVKTYNYNDLASVVTLVKNSRTEALLNKTFHTGNKSFLNFEDFIKENVSKTKKIAILVQKIPNQIADRTQVLQLIYRAKPEIEKAVNDKVLVVEEMKRQFEYMGNNKRFIGSCIVTMSGVLVATPENSIKTEITYKVVAGLKGKDGKTKWNPVFRINPIVDPIKDSAVFLISKDFEDVRDSLEKKFERIEATGFEKKGKENRQAKSAADRWGKICKRCKDAGFDDKRHPTKICPTPCVTCKTNCNNNNHCKAILRKRHSDSKREEYVKKRKALESGTWVIKYFSENTFFCFFFILFSKKFHSQNLTDNLHKSSYTKLHSSNHQKSTSNHQKSTQHHKNRHQTLNIQAPLLLELENPKLPIIANHSQLVPNLKSSKPHQNPKKGIIQVE